MPAVIESTLYDAPPPGGTVIAGTTQQNSRDDLRLGYHVTLRSVHAATTYSWSLAFVSDSTGTTVPGTPFDGTQSISALLPPENATSRDAKFNVDYEGSYLVRLTIDAALPTEDTQFIRCRALTVFGALKLVAAGERRDDQGVIPVDASAEGWANDHNSNIQRISLLLRRVSTSGRILYVDSNRGRDSSSAQDDYDNLISIPGPDVARPEETGIKLRAMAHGDFSTINSAIAYAAAAASRSEPAPSKIEPYYIVVRPGVYDEDLNLTSFVHIIGEGPSFNDDVKGDTVSGSQGNGVTVTTQNTGGTGTHRYNPLGLHSVHECFVYNLLLENTANTTNPVVDHQGGLLRLEKCTIIQSGDAVTQGPCVQTVVSNVAHAPALWMHDSTLISYMTTADRTALLFNATSGISQLWGVDISAPLHAAVRVNEALYQNCDLYVRQGCLLSGNEGVVGYPSNLVVRDSEIDNTTGPSLDVTSNGGAPGAKAGDVTITVDRSTLASEVSFRTVAAAGTTSVYISDTVNLGGAVGSSKLVLPEAPGDLPNNIAARSDAEFSRYADSYVDPRLGAGAPTTVPAANKLPVQDVQRAIDFLARAVFPVTGSPFFSLDSSYDGLQSMSPWTPGTGLGRTIVADGGAVQITGGAAPLGIDSHLKMGGLQTEGIIDIGGLVTGTGNETIADVGHSEISLNPNMLGAGPFISLGRASWTTGIAGGNRGFGGAVLLADQSPLDASFNLHMRTADGRVSSTGTNRLGNIYVAAGGSNNTGNTVPGDVHVIAGSSIHPAATPGNLYLVPGRASATGVREKVFFVGGDDAIINTAAILTAANVYIGGVAGTIFIGTPSGVEQFVFDGTENYAAAQALFSATAKGFIAGDSLGKLSLIGSWDPSADIMYVGDTVGGALNTALGDLTPSAATFTPGTYGWMVGVDVPQANRLRVTGDLEVTGILIGGGPAFGTYVAVTNALSPYAVVDGVGIMGTDSSGGAVTVSLPSAAANEGRLLIVKSEVGGSTAAVNPTGGDTIEGTTTFSILDNAVGHAVTFYSDGGTDWKIWNEFKPPGSALKTQTGTPLTVLGSDRYEVIMVQLTATVDTSIVLHTDLAVGTMITIKDETGIANAIASPAGQKIIITDGVGALIDGAAALDILSAYGAVTLVKHSGGWAII